MIQRVLADLILALHLAFVAFVLLGGLLAWRWRRAPWLHLPAVLWGVFVEVTGGRCPLTPLEVSLREAAGEAGYAGSFVDHYLTPLLYPAGLTPPVQWGLAAVVVLTNALVYGWVWWARPAARGER